MTRSNLIGCLFTAVLGALPLGASAQNTAAQLAGQSSGSALPPRVNPSPPAVGTGGDANGYEKRTAIRPADGDATGKKPVGKTQTHQKSMESSDKAVSKTKKATAPVNEQ
ncbi:hypothetical protein [Pseudomonas sp. NFR16]|uniref:hypothetical protein n=1 Tax=Pseudomonas sp. NFR16 TaxID=1566248 RepID=UPI0008C8D4E4|nr:hypothetical protein [Pseudomonas sp. NFR16]SEI62876.1 hypothetical protein SAMN03159495_1101 [Pseudomonas sp. NFR16]